MRVLHVVEAVEGGVARHVVDLVRHVDAQHHVVMPAERVGGYTDRAARGAIETAGGKVSLVPMRRSAIDPRNAWATARVRGLIASWRADVVHGHSSIGGAAARLGAARTGVARVYTPNGLAQDPFAVRVERFLGRFTDRFVAVSESEAELAAELRLADPATIEVVPNGIELEPIPSSALDLRHELGLPADTPVVATIARLVPQKAPEIYVRACARVARALPEPHFLMIGQGPLANLVGREVAASGLEDRWHQWPGFPDAASLMPQFDVFVQASRFEGAPYAPLEAMRTGTPVIVSDVVGNRDTVEHGSSGLVIPADDPVALADAITGLLSDADARDRLAEGGRRRVAERFDLRMTSERMRELYERVAG